jgi:hypothetical protein
MYLNLLKGTSVLGHMLCRWELYKLNGHKGELTTHTCWSVDYKICYFAHSPFYVLLQRYGTSYRKMVLIRQRKCPSTYDIRDDHPVIKSRFQCN